MWVPSRDLLNAALLALNADTFPVSHGLDGCSIVLFKEPIAQGFDTKWVDVSAAEADYSGYARHVIAAWNGPTIGADQTARLSDDAVVWEADDTVTTNTIYAQGLLGSDSATLLATEVFDQPIQMTGPGVSFIDVPIFGFTPNISGYGKSIVSN